MATATIQTTYIADEHLGFSTFRTAPLERNPLRQQVQPRTQLYLTPHERTQITNAQRILQPTLNALFIIILSRLRRIISTTGDARGLGFPSSDGIEEVFPDFDV